MDRADKIMEQLGFKKDADDSIKAAFLKNLIKQAYGVDVPVPPQYQAPPPPPTIEDMSADVLAGRPLPEKPGVGKVNAGNIRATGASTREACPTPSKGFNSFSINKNLGRDQAQLSFNFSVDAVDAEEPPKVG